MVVMEDRSATMMRGIVDRPQGEQGPSSEETER
jgi:hypothetical protein